MTWLQDRADAGDAAALEQVSDMRQETRRFDGAATSWLDIFKGGYIPDYGILVVDLLWNAGRIDEATTWFQRAAEAGQTTQLGPFARELWESGRLDEAITFLQDRVAEGREGRTLGEVADLLREAGRIDEANGLRRFGFEPDGNWASPWGVESGTTLRLESTH
jgi:TPR repeat protein